MTSQFSRQACLFQPRPQPCPRCHSANAASSLKLMVCLVSPALCCSAHALRQLLDTQPFQQWSDLNWPSATGCSIVQHSLVPRLLQPILIRANISAELSGAFPHDRCCSCCHCKHEFLWNGQVMYAGFTLISDTQIHCLPVIYLDVSRPPHSLQLAPEDIPDPCTMTGSAHHSDSGRVPTGCPVK